MLKNKLFAGAVIALAMFAIAAQASASSIVKLGSKGADVMTVQKAVGVTADGSFGPLTKAAVIAFQSNHGLTADGVVGSKTWAVINTVSTTTTTTTTTGAGALCPNGMTLASNCSVAPAAATTVALCPNGMTLSSNCTVAAAATSTTVTTTTGNTDGSITLGASSYVSSGVQIKKGQTADIAAVRMQAIAGPVKVSYVDVTFNVRPWLFFNQVTLHDSTGKVIATKALNSIADTTEITVGSSYQVRFDGLNYTVTPGTSIDLAVGASVLAATDKIPSNGQSVTAGIADMRTISEVGYSNTATYTGTNTVTLTSTGSVADLYSRISPSSPVAGQQVVSLTQITPGVTLGIFSLKSANNSSTLNTLTANVTVTGTANGTTATATNAFSNYRLFVNGQGVAGGVVSGNTVTFSNMTVALAQDTWTDITIKADINQAVSGTVTVGLTANTTNLVITDSNYGIATIETGSNPTSNVLTMTTNSLNVSNIVATLGSAIVQSNSTVGYNATYGFTLTNNSNNDLFVSSTPTTMMGMTSTGTNTLTSVTVSPSTVNGDASGVYAIPAGTARTFSFTGSLRATAGTSAVYTANAINYGTTAGTPTGIQLTSGLSGLTLTASF